MSERGTTPPYRLPIEMEFEVLHRPTDDDDLIRCCAVCKPWCSLITSPSFLRHHLAAASSRPSLFLLRGSFESRRISESREFISLHRNEPSLPFIRTLPFSIPPNFHIVDSSHGVICLAHNTLSTSDIILCNPSINRCLHLPSPTITYPPHYNKNLCVETGFGYDGASQNFKVLQMAYGTRNAIESMPVELYSTGSGSWRLLDMSVTPKCQIVSPPSQALVRGRIHWVAYHLGLESARLFQRTVVVLVFDLAREVFDEIPLPGNLGLDFLTRGMIIPYHESSTIVLLQRKVAKECDMWVMEEAVFD